MPGGYFSSANFLELRKGEVRRTPLQRTPVNKPPDDVTEGEYLPTYQPLQPLGKQGAADL